MPTVLRLEGPDLESLLSRVRDEIGPDARILEAQKRRTGGLAGFFAKEKFEVAVEVAGDGSATPPAGTSGSTDATSSDPGSSGPPAAPATLLELSEQVSAAERAQEQGPATFGAEVLPQRPDPEDVAHMSTETPEFAALLSHLRGGLGSGGALAIPAAPVEPDSPADAPRVPVSGSLLAERGSTASRLLDLGMPPGLLPDAAALHSSATYTALVDALAALPTPPRPPSSAGEVLVLVGDAAVAYRTAVAVAQSVRIDPESIVVASPLRRGTGLPEERHVPHARAAESLSGTLHGGEVPAVVVVDAPMDPSAAAWTRGVVAAFRPDSVWAVVDATRKSPDVSSWLARLGGAEALALTGLESTSDPGAPLALGTPVSLLDGHRATPAAWAGLLCERLVGDGLRLL